MDRPATPDDLYGLDPAEFVAARDLLARGLRADGQKEDAARVAKLRRPPQSTWALNLLARTDPERIDEVLGAATALRDALEGGGDDRRVAQGAYRDAIDAAVRAAAELAGITGDDMLTRIRTNLLAAGVDEELAKQLQNGTLPDDQEAPGFGGTPTIGPIERGAPRSTSKPAPLGGRSTPSDATAGSKAGRKDRPKTGSKAGGKAGSGADEGAAAARAKQQEREAAAARAQEQVDELERKRTARRRAELGRELERLEKKATRLEQQAESAEERAAAARQAADEATAAAAEVAEQLRRL